MEPADIQPPRTLQLQNNLEQEHPQFSASVLEQLRFHLYGAAIEDVKIIIITSRDSPPSASFHCYGTPLTTFPRRHFHYGDSTVTILVDIMMLGQCMLLVIASDMMNRMPIPRLMECKASDYAESHSTCKQTLVVARVYTLLSTLRNSQAGYWRPTVSPPSRFPSPRMKRFSLYSL